MKLSSTIALAVSLGIYLASQQALGVIIFLKGQEDPIRGYFVRENDHVVVVDQVISDGTTRQRAVSRSEIEDLIQTVSAARLEALQPANPDRYREYAEELAEKSKDPDAQVAAIRLFLIAAHLEPQRLGRSCLLALVPLARSSAEQRRFRAMAYLLDPTHDPQLLTMPLATTTRHRGPEPPQSESLLGPLRLLRQGHQREALHQAQRVKLKEQLHLLTDPITYQEFEQACDTKCQHCQRGRKICPVCKGQRKSCATCGALGEIRCPVCGGDFRHNPLPPSLLQRIVQLELDALPAGEAVSQPPPAMRPAWSRTVQHGDLDPLPPLSLETLTEFDPRMSQFRDGQWTR